jgi:hypothetical protein
MNEFIGTIGERSIFFAKLLERRNITTHYGESVIYTIITRPGRRGSFFSEDYENLSVGSCFHFKGTVKLHHFNKYSLKNETKFNRVVIQKRLGTVDSPILDNAVNF